eukprot:7320821-Prymnesium_polylepis.1
MPARYRRDAATGGVTVTPPGLKSGCMHAPKLPACPREDELQLSAQRCGLRGWILAGRQDL